MRQPMTRIIHIGPNPARSQGGMATVIDNLLSNEALNDKYSMELYPSFIGGKPIGRFAYSEKQLLHFTDTIDNEAIYHIHMGPDRSVWRKLRYAEKIWQANARLIIHVHASTFDVFFDSLSERKKRTITKKIDYASRLILLSEEWQNYFKKHEICDEHKTEILHNAVNAPKENDIDYSRRIILFMGRLGERKSPDILLRAARIVIERHPDASFVFGGDGDIVHYEQLASKLGILKNCSFLGWLSGNQKHAAFLSASVYCLPSKNEGMPMSVLEAMSYGLATVSTPVGGMPQVIDDGVDGFFFPVDDVEALASILDKLLSSQDLRMRIGNAGREKILSKFGMDAYARSLARIYQEVLR